MKPLKLIALGIILLATNAIQAQISVNVNIGSPPVWGPPVAAEVEYYYLPEIEAYYDIRATQFVYFGGGRWIRSRNLPSHYRNYDLHHGHKVVLHDYHGRRPYSHFKSHKVKYYKGYGNNNHRPSHSSRPQYRDNHRERDNHRGDYNRRPENNRHDNRDKNKHNDRGDRDNRHENRRG
jgi:hypothetical protein